MVGRRLDERSVALSGCWPIEAAVVGVTEAAENSSLAKRVPLH
jgi:hypothetical protein